MLAWTTVTATQHLEQLMPMSFHHVVEIREDTRRLTIYRVYPDGRKELYTQVELPQKSVDDDKAGFERFARILGENLLIDSPTARKLLKL